MFTNSLYAKAYQGLSQLDGPVAAFYSAGEGFLPLIAALPTETFTAHNAQQVLSFEHRHQDDLIVAAFPFEFPESPATLSAFPAWVRIDLDGQHIEGSDPEAKELLSKRCKQPAKPTANQPLGLSEETLDPAAYQESIQQIFEWIRAGEVYQLNYTTQLKAQTNADPRDWFLPSIDQSPPPFSALFSTDEFSLLSLSPERFIQTDGERIYTDPIKGTGPRLPGDIDDKLQRAWLQSSEKEAAELNMITDLLRNDLGQICQVGSVSIETPRTVSAHLEVLHTHTRVAGKLKKRFHGLAALLEMLPGGSISGCPKGRAVELIRQIETEPRGFYTGALGYRLPGGDLCFNLMIRTLVFQSNQVSLGVGGGITLDSDPAAELAEAKQKAKSVLTRFSKT